MDESEVMNDLVDEINTLRDKISHIASGFEDDTRYTYYDGDFKINFLNGDTLRAHRIRITKPPYRPGDYGYILSVRIQKEGRNPAVWGNCAWITFAPDSITSIEKIHWKPSDEDAFQISTEKYEYYYAVRSALDGFGHHWYREDRISHEASEVEPDEIVDLIQNHPDKITNKCPCVRIRNGKLVPVVEWK